MTTHKVFLSSLSGNAVAAVVPHRSKFLRQSLSHWYIALVFGRVLLLKAMTSVGTDAKIVSGNNDSRTEKCNVIVSFVRVWYFSRRRRYSLHFNHIFTSTT